MKDKNNKLVPRGKAAEEFGIDKQTITNWYSEGLLQGTYIKGKLFISCQSIENLKNLYPEVVADVNCINAYKKSLTEQKEQLSKELTTLRKERIYRRMAPSYIKAFIKRAVQMLKRTDMVQSDKVRYLLDEELIECWMFGYDINKTCEKKGIPYFHYIKISEIYENILQSMDTYTYFIEQNNQYRLQAEVSKQETERTLAALCKYQGALITLKGTSAVEYINPLFKRSLTEFDFSVRVYNIFGYNKIETVGDLVSSDRRWLENLSGMGKKSMTEIDEFLTKYNLFLNMHPDLCKEKEGLPGNMDKYLVNGSSVDNLQIRLYDFVELLNKINRYEELCGEYAEKNQILEKEQKIMEGKIQQQDRQLNIALKELRRCKGYFAKAAPHVLKQLGLND